MSTISKMETPTGQEEAAILLEEYVRRIATLQESLRQAGRIHPNEAVILQEIKRVVEERDDLKRKLENAEMLIERLKREVKELNFSVALHDRAAEKARAIWAEAHPDEAEEWLRREDLMVWLMDRVERAEAVKESLTSALRGIKEISDEWNLSDYKRISDLAETALRTAEESSVVGLIGSTPAKQPEDSANADEDVESLIDDGGGGMTHTPGPWKVTADKPRLADNPRLIVEDDIGDPVCAMSLRGVYGDTVKMTANAHLIAAAPEMLDALVEVKMRIEGYITTCPLCGESAERGHKYYCLWHVANDAIRKARGEVHVRCSRHGGATACTDCWNEEVEE